MNPEKYALRIVRTETPKRGVKGCNMPSVGVGYVVCEELGIRVQHKTIGAAVYEAREIARVKLAALLEGATGYERIEILQALEDLTPLKTEAGWSLDGEPEPEDEISEDLLKLFL